MDVDEKKQNIHELNISNILNPKSVWFYVFFDDDDEVAMNNDLNIVTGTCGRGNAKSGKRRPYILYQPSTIYERVCLPSLLFFKFRTDVCSSFLVEAKT